MICAITSVVVLLLGQKLASRVVTDLLDGTAKLSQASDILRAWLGRQFLGDAEHVRLV